MAKLTIALYGADVGANNVLDAVMAMAEPKLNVLRHTGHSRPSSDFLQKACTCDAVFLGISSGMPEAQFAEKVLHKNPGQERKIFFLEDFPGSSGVKDNALQRIGPKVGLCSILPLSPHAPERQVYGRVCDVGIPSHWFHAMENMRDGAWMRKSKNIFKRRRGREEQFTLEPDDVVLYLSGFKNPPVELACLKYMHSLRSVRGKPVVVHFRPHPGERNRPDLAGAIMEREAFLSEQWEIANNDIVNGKYADARLIGAADVTIAHPGATSIFLGAAASKRMICVMDFVEEEDLRTSSYNYAYTGRYACIVQNILALRQAVPAVMDDNSEESLQLFKQRKLQSLRFGTSSTYAKNVLAQLSGVTSL